MIIQPQKGRNPIENLLNIKLGICFRIREYLHGFTIYFMVDFQLLKHLLIRIVNLWIEFGDKQMKILKIDHLGIAVSSIEEKKNFWIDALGMTLEGTETIEEQKVTTAFLPVGESEIELLESTSKEGPVAKYIEKKGEGIQHIAFRVENIEEALLELKEKGIKLIDQTPRIGAGGAKIAFLHPKATSGVLVELCER